MKQILLLTLVVLTWLVACNLPPLPRSTPPVMQITISQPYEILAVEEYPTHVKVYLFAPTITKVSEDWDAAILVRDQIFKREKTAIIGIVGEPSDFYRWWREDAGVLYWIFFRYPPIEHPRNG